MASHCESLSVILPTPADYTPSTSPSVYIAYNGLEAYISCTSYGNVARGKPYNTTIAYEPAYLSTSISARAEQTCAFTEIIYTELANYPYSDGSSLILSLPSDLSSVDPAWSTCVPNSYGAFDPPSTLLQATALTEVSPESTLSVHAKPGGHVGFAYSPATTTTSISESPSRTPSTPSSDQSKNLKIIDPSDNSLAAGNSKIDKDVTESVHDKGQGESHGTVGDFTKPPPPSNLPYLPLKSEQSIVQDPNNAESISPTSHASISLAQISEAILPIEPSDVILGSSAQALSPTSDLKAPIIDDQSKTRAPDDEIIFASHSIAGNTVYAGLSNDAVIDGSTYIALATTTGDPPPEAVVTLANGLVVSSPHGSSPNRVEIGTQKILSPNNGPAITLSSGTPVSLSSPSSSGGVDITLSIPNATEKNSSSSTIHQSGTSLIIAGADTNASSNAVVFTGMSSSRYTDHHRPIMMIIILALLAIALV